jgi:hypothetical protein
MESYNTWDRVHSRILNLEGEVFRTKTGLEFKFKLDKHLMWTSRSKRPILMKDLKRVHERLQYQRFDEIPMDFRKDFVCSYTWSILSDDRVLIDENIFNHYRLNVVDQ